MSVPSYKNCGIATFYAFLFVLSVVHVSEQAKKAHLIVVRTFQILMYLYFVEDCITK